MTDPKQKLSNLLSKIQSKKGMSRKSLIGKRFSTYNIEIIPITQHIVRNERM